MRKAILSILGGAIFLLPLMFASCGNIDNPLEIIDTSGSGGGGGGAEETTTISYVEYSVSGETATPTTKTLAEGAYTVVTADLAELTAAKPYVVNTDVTIDHDITLSGDAEIIICDGKTLIVNGKMNDATPLSPTTKLVVYGQSGKSGSLNVSCTDAADATMAISVKEFNIHGAKVISSSDNSKTGQAIHVEEDFNLYEANVTVTAPGEDTQATEVFGIVNVYKGSVLKSTGNMNGLMTGTLNIYGGDVTINGGVLGTTIAPLTGAGADGINGSVKITSGSLYVKGGDAKASSNKNGGKGIAGGGTLTINGGTVEIIGGNGDGTGNGGVGIEATTIVTDCVKVTATGGDGDTKGGCFSGYVTPANTLKYSDDDGASYTNSDGSAQLFSMIPKMIIIPQ